MSRVSTESGGSGFPFCCKRDPHPPASGVSRRHCTQLPDRARPCNKPRPLRQRTTKYPQALYFCEPLRHHLALVREEDANSLSAAGGDNNSGSSGGGGGGGGGTGRGRGGALDNSVLSQLAELFASISKQKRRSGHLAPTEFLRTLRERNDLFRGNMQQVTRYFVDFVVRMHTYAFSVSSGGLHIGASV